MPTTMISSDYNTVTVASQKLQVMVAGFQYVLRGSIDLWYAVGPNASVTASAADGSHYLPAGEPALVALQGANDTVAVLRVGALDGVCTLSREEAGTTH